jgi:hypothetical protein
LEKVELCVRKFLLLKNLKINYYLLKITQLEYSKQVKSKLQLYNLYLLESFNFSCAISALCTCTSSLIFLGKKVVRKVKNVCAYNSRSCVIVPDQSFDVFSRV